MALQSVGDSNEIEGLDEGHKASLAAALADAGSSCQTELEEYTHCSGDESQHPLGLALQRGDVRHRPVLDALLQLFPDAAATPLPGQTGHGQLPLHAACVSCQFWG
eukprot:SAG31_NODE_13454_length_868_cov_1.110533_2_plen_106_part_00